MKNKIAVVFDSAGTLLHMSRVVKHIPTRKYITNIPTTNIVAQGTHYGLVILHTEPDKIIICQSDKRINDFLDDNNIKIALSCSTGPITLDEVKESIENDYITIMQDIHDVINRIKNKCPDIFYLGIGIIVDIKDRSIVYTVCTGGRPFNNTSIALYTLHDQGIDTYIASGDSMRNLGILADLVDIPVDRVYDVATPKRKEWVVRHLQIKYDKVIMVGDGINDILALRASDKAVLSIQQTGTCSKQLYSNADIIITDILQIVEIARNCSC
ncbi:MAG: HAD family hydrolase [Methanosarcinales archaeon]|nr:HAD family hydrolase [Methanosarcinales archaeon]